MGGSTLTKKIKDLKDGDKLDLEKIETLIISDVFKIDVGNQDIEAKLAQLKNQGCEIEQSWVKKSRTLTDFFLG